MGDGVVPSSAAVPHRLDMCGLYIYRVCIRMRGCVLNLLLLLLHSNCVLAGARTRSLYMRLRMHIYDERHAAQSSDFDDTLHKNM